MCQRGTRNGPKTTLGLHPHDFVIVNAETYPESISTPVYNKAISKLRKAQEERRNHEQLKELVDKMKEKEEKKDLYEEAAQVEKLTVPQLKEQVTEALSGKYSNIVFEKPDMGRVVSVEFSVEEMSTKNERVSERELKKLLKELLRDSNWRLMTEGISYRLGVLTGKLRVYESEEDLVKLLEKK